MYSFSDAFQVSFFEHIGVEWLENRWITPFINDARLNLKILMNSKVHERMFYPSLHSGCEKQKCNDCSYSKQAY